MGFQATEFTDAPLRHIAMARLDARPEDVFAHVSDARRLCEWVPLVRVSSGNGADAPNQGLGSERTCETAFETIRERIVHWDAPRSYAYRVVSPKAPFRDHLGVMEVKDDGLGGTLLTLHQYYEPRRSLRGALMRVSLPWILRGALRNLTRKFGGEVVQAAA